MKPTTLERALDLLEYLSRRKEMSFGEIAEDLNIPKATLSRMLKTLKRREYLKQDPYTKRYRLGCALLVIGNSILDTLELREIARPYMQKLLKETRETVELAVMEEGTLIYIDKLESSESIRLFARIGSRYSTLHATAPGKVMLAFGGEELLRNLLEKVGLKRFTEKTITERKALEKELEEIKKRGWAFDDEEVRIGVRRIASPIFDYKGKLAGVVGIAGPIFRITLEKKEKFGRLVKEMADKISRELGFQKEG